ncbi:lipid droplet-associated hydrolase isoform X1 [Seriola lalandi dorsalis]|uniref:lipid droplet-associated hydrolase isoform X1 n=1 Tax=Seriola lalandi dorsalis TaxID=1841481 RepID=UPI000C6F956C|nr:lipid droplet-associated hydrolase isoform X1 [Seriola lalandi dorsalis]XP_056248579.1 lipid droplet-associated hydrolase isoform X1 [Seriola aureovittata]
MVTGSRDEPQTDFIFCCGANTEVLKFGSCQLHSGHKILFLIIPGNPGVVGFYKTFMQTLHSMFGYHHPVWAVSHAGHCVPPDSMDMVQGTNDSQDASSAAEADVFGLNGQIEHKLAFLRKHVPKETNLILVGHSIGCYIILEMIKRDPELKILKAVMLFPTIERMAQTPQGKVMTPVLCHMRYVAYLPLFLLSLLPDRFKSSLIKLVFGGIHSLDLTVVQPTVGLLTGDCAANAMYMGGQEMKNVLERDNITIKNNLEKLIFYYGATDHWCPVQYYLDIKQDFPHGDIRLCENGFRHAFVLDAGGEVAKMVVEWIHGDLRT